MVLQLNPRVQSEFWTLSLGGWDGISIHCFILDISVENASKLALFSAFWRILRHFEFWCLKFSKCLLQTEIQLLKFKHVLFLHTCTIGFVPNKLSDKYETEKAHLNFLNFFLQESLTKSRSSSKSSQKRHIFAMLNNIWTFRSLQRDENVIF